MIRISLLYCKKRHFHGQLPNTAKVKRNFGATESVQFNFNAMKVINRSPSNPGGTAPRETTPHNRWPLKQLATATQT